MGTVPECQKTFTVAVAIIVHPWEEGSAHPMSWNGLACKGGKYLKAKVAWSTEGRNCRGYGKGGVGAEIPNLSQLHKQQGWELHNDMNHSHGFIFKGCPGLRSRRGPVPPETP